MEKKLFKSKNLILLVFLFLTLCKGLAQCNVSNFNITGLNGTCAQNASIQVQIPGAVTCSSITAQLNQVGNSTILSTVSVSAAGTATFAALPPGNYEVRVIDSTNQVHGPQTVNLTTSYVALNYSTVTTTGLCAVADAHYIPSASIAMNVNSGTGILPFIYSVTTSLGTQTFGPTNDTSHTFNNLPNGETYTTKITDGCGTEMIKNPTMEAGGFTPKMNLLGNSASATDQHNYVFFDRICDQAPANCDRYRVTFRLYGGNRNIIGSASADVKITINGTQHIMTMQSNETNHTVYTYDGIVSGDSFTFTADDGCDIFTYSDIFTTSLSVVLTNHSIMESDCTPLYRVNLRSLTELANRYTVRNICTTNTVLVEKEQPSGSGNYVTENVVQDHIFTSNPTINNLNGPSRIPVSGPGVYRFTVTDGCSTVVRDITINSLLPTVTATIRNTSNVAGSVLDGTSGLGIRVDQGAAPVLVSIRPTSGVSSSTFTAGNPGISGNLSGTYTINWPLQYNNNVQNIYWITDLPPDEYEISLTDNCGATNVYTVSTIAVTTYNPIFTTTTGCAVSSVNFNFNATNRRTDNANLSLVYNNNGTPGATVSGVSFTNGNELNGNSIINIPPGSYFLKSAYQETRPNTNFVSSERSAVNNLASSIVRTFLVPIEIAGYEPIDFSTGYVFCDVNDINSAIVSVDIDPTTGSHPFTVEIYQATGYVAGVSTPLQSAVITDPTDFNHLFNGLTTNDYLVRVADACGAFTRNVTPSLVQNISITSLPAAPICPSEAVELFINLSASLFDIEWTNSNGDVVGTGSAITLNPLQTDTYTATYTNSPSLGCVSTVTGSESATVTVFPELEVNTASINTNCLANGSGYTLTMTVNIGTAPYTVTGTGASGTWVDNVWTSDTIPAGTNYNVILEDVNQCSQEVISGAAPICCAFEVICPTFSATVVGCHVDIPTATTLTEAQFVTLGNGNGAIGNTPCGVIEITASNTAAPACEGNVERTYTVTEYADTNNNGIRDTGENIVLNTQSCTQTYIIERNDFIIPVNASSTVACLSEVVTPTVPTVTDACGNTLTPSSPVISTLPSCEGNVIYTYTFTDCKGNSHDWVYTYTIEKEDFTMPANTSSTVACPLEVIAPTVPVVIDACGNTLTPNAPVVSTMPTCEGDVTYTYTFTDCEGNSHDWVYTYIIERNDFTMPENASSTVACPLEVIAPTVPTVTDACGNTLTPSAPVVSAMPACEGNVIYTYTFTDCKGNSHDWVYTYTIERNDFIMPANASSTVACPSEVIAPTVPTVIDACGNTLTPSSPVISTLPSCEGNVTYTYTFTDCKGNSHDWIYTYTIDDTIAPTGTAPADITGLQCITEVPVADVNLVTNAADNCNGEVIVTVADMNNGASGCNGSPYIITRTYTLTDCAGNETTLVQTITVEDTTAPVFVESLPTDLVLECSDAIPVAPILTATDNCSTAAVVYEEQRVNGSCVNNYELIRTWVASDECGNETVHIQTIEINDTTKPVFNETLPEDAYANCNGIPVAPVLTATDNCGTATVSFTETEVPGDCTNRYSLVREWVATDICGNQTTHTQTVYLACYVTVYNAVSPNGDGLNDTFLIEGVECYPNNSIEIYNRWGAKVYETKGYDNVSRVFKGYSEGKNTISQNELLPTGVYFYVLKYEYDLYGTYQQNIEKSGYLYIQSN